MKRNAIMNITEHKGTGLLTPLRMTTTHLTKRLPSATKFDRRQELALMGEWGWGTL